MKWKGRNALFLRYYSHTLTGAGGLSLHPLSPCRGRGQAGQLQQADINLYYYNARYYDPALGRFVQSDTIVPQPYSVQGYDRYAYVNNNPIRYTDPSGHGLDCGINDPYCNAAAHGMSYETYASYTPYTPPTTVIGAVGVGAGNGDFPVSGYNQGNGTADEIPLAPYSNWASSRGYNYSPVGVDKYRGRNLNAKYEQALEILNIIKDAKGKVYLAGHSAGADSVILAVDMAIAQGFTAKIAGVVLLDPYFEYQEYDGSNVGEWFPLQEKADRISAALPGKIFVGDTPNDYDVNTNESIIIDIKGALYERYEINSVSKSKMSHEMLAVADEVLDKILESGVFK